MYWTYFACFFTGAMFTVTSAECNVTQFSCANGNCINMAWQCDGDDDCRDNTDEAECTATTCSDGFFRCDNGKCIPERWVCDDSPECPDKSDEKPELCKNQTCMGYRCGNTSHCIPNEWKCDSQADCPNEEDETECNHECDPATEFQCADKKCISIRWECDHHNDCEDGSDEVKCTKTGCHGSDENMCIDGECIHNLWWCDGETDCKDGSDEANCTQKLSGQTCESTEFQCFTPIEDPQCINAGWKCDGHKDCNDGSDESSCLGHTCSPEEIKCDNHSCLRQEFVCDGENDCDDNEDERNCTYTDIPGSRCKINEFDCGSKCISYEKMCDGKHDCADGVDEATGLNCSLKTNITCEIKNGGCSHLCVPNANIEAGRRCECPTGYTMASGSSTECEDIDECTVSGTCSQMCTNTKGSYKCACFTDYTLTSHRYCKANNGDTELILSDRHDLRRYHLDTSHYSLLVDQLVSGAVALDFDIRNKIIVWSDVQSETIYLADLTTGKVKPIIENTNKTEGLAIDWIHRNLYFSDTDLKRIEVARLDGSCRKILVKENLAEPRALVLDPNNGWMYWTDWGSKPKIEKCAMDGQNRKEIVTKHIMWPNGITIDYVQNRLYWVDARLHTIGSSDLDGNNYKLILRDLRNLGHPYAITVFEDYLYWTDWISNAVHRFSKFAHDNMSTIALDLKMPMGIHVYHLYRQPVIMNHCGDNNGGCSHLCLPVPQVKTGTFLTKKSVCACPDSMVLVDSLTCGQSSQKQPQTSRPFSESTIQTADETTGQIFQTTQHAGGVNASMIVAQQAEGVGLVAGIVIIILLVAGLVLVLAIFLLLKRHKSRNVKSMNFDNPVYRRTTMDDQREMDKSESNLPQSMQLLNPDSDDCVILNDRPFK